MLVSVCAGCRSVCAVCRYVCGVYGGYDNTLYVLRCVGVFAVFVEVCVNSYMCAVCGDGYGCAVCRSLSAVCMGQVLFRSLHPTRR